MRDDDLDDLVDEDWCEICDCPIGSGYCAVCAAATATDVADDEEG